jgi:hypothetical protein
LWLPLQFDAIEALEAAIAADGTLSRLPVNVMRGRSVTQQAMLTRHYPVPDGRVRTPASGLPCS